ncbi:diacylglycerol kinase family lipid kinase [Pseudactinotalea sp. HY160]|nr:diacylglycerol kinase family protein [Pseudactinotalea sp. HY160]MPV49308.1 diacylglycerol kinase family lipid kinase [Pseudactinotalea sp. HY160]
MRRSHRLGVIVNPVAGHGRGRTGGHTVLTELARCGYEVVDLSGQSATDALRHAHSARADYDALVVVGGDGMAHLGFNAVAGTPTPLGLIAVGSGNDLARSLGLPIHDVPAGIALIGAALSGPPRRIDAIETTVAAPHPARVSTRPDGLDWAAAIVSAGFDAAVNDRANSYRRPRGGARYVRGVLAELRTFRPYGYRLTIDGATREFDGALVALANGRTFGGGMAIAPDARLDDGLIDVVIARDIGRAELLRVFPRVYRGTHVDHPAVEVLRARHVRIEAIEGHPSPVPVAFADGEPLGAVPLEATIRPGAVRFLGPG